MHGKSRWSLAPGEQQRTRRADADLDAVIQSGGPSGGSQICVTWLIAPQSAGTDPRRTGRLSGCDGLGLATLGPRKDAFSTGCYRLFHR